MKKRLTGLILVILLTFILIACGAPSESTDQIVEFKDDNLEQYIRGIINKAEEPIYTSDLEKLNTWLALPGGYISPRTIGDIESRKVADITGLEYCHNLRRVDFSRNNIQDISPLSSLKKLNTLIIYGNEITDISPLKPLNNLFLLHIQENQISDITAFSSLSKLKSLYAGENNISDISPLSSLSNLDDLRLNLNHIVDISPLSSLSSISYIDLSDNEISDISPLSSLNEVTILDLSNNQIRDIKPLVDSSNIGYGVKLNLTSNPLSDVSINSYIPQLIERGVEVEYAASGGNTRRYR